MSKLLSFQVLVTWKGYAICAPDILVREKKKTGLNEPDGMLGMCIKIQVSIKLESRYGKLDNLLVLTDHL